MAEKRTRHGLFAPMAKIKLKGLAVVDRRTLAARSLLGWRQELVNALGGEESITPQESALIDAVSRTKLILEHVDAYIVSQPSIVNRKRKGLIPIIQQRNSITNVLVNLLSQLGLKRRPKRVASLAEYLQEREERKHGDDDDRAGDGESEALSADVPEAGVAEEE